MSAHTPGPWQAYRADHQGGPREAPIFVVGPEEFHTVAQVRAGNTDDDLPAQTPANARLIAAAPDMLEALRLVWDTYGFDPSIDSSIWQTVLAAIAKATGETK